MTKHWPLSFPTRNHTHIRDLSPSCMCVFHVILPYGHAEPLITFLLRAHFFANITTEHITAKRINDCDDGRNERMGEKTTQGGQILMLYGIFTFLTIVYAAVSC